MDRRSFVVGGLAAVAAPVAAVGQQTNTLRRVALVFTTSPVSEMAGPEPVHPSARIFIGALRDLGWVENRNLILERRSGEGRFEDFGRILRDLVALKCDVIVTTGTLMTQEARRITRTVPIVFTSVSEPVGTGLVPSLARPGGNVTGLASDPGSEFEGKVLEIVKLALPNAKRVSVLEMQGGDSVWGESRRRAASRLDLAVMHVEPQPNDYTGAFAAIMRQRPDAVVVGRGSYLFANRQGIVDFANQNRLPLFGQGRAFTYAGGRTR